MRELMKYNNSKVQVGLNGFLDLSKVEYQPYGSQKNKAKTVLIDKKHLSKITLIDKLTFNKRKKRDFRWLFSQTDFRDIKNIKLTLSQLREIKLILKHINLYNENFKLSTLATLIKNNQTNLLKRMRLVMNVKSNKAIQFYNQLLYGKEEGTKRWYDMKVKPILGEDNPAYMHGGKNSSLSKNFIKYNNLSEEDMQKEMNKVASKISSSNKYNGNNNATLVYYTKKGILEEEAKELLSIRQRTFSLDVCIKKHGFEEGTKIFNERQVKWQDTLNSKPQEEKDRINIAKSTSLGFGVSKYGPRRYIADNTPSMLYYLRFFNEEIEFFKVGITKKTLDERFGHASTVKRKHNLNMEILFQKSDILTDVYILEQYILNKFKNERVNINYNNFKSTECFHKNILNNILNLNESEILKFKQQRGYCETF